MCSEPIYNKIVIPDAETVSTKSSNQMMFSYANLGAIRFFV